MDQAAASHRRSVSGVSSTVVVLAPDPCDRGRRNCELDLWLPGPASIYQSRWKNHKGVRYYIRDWRSANDFFRSAARHGDLWLTIARSAGHCDACGLDSGEDTNTSCWARRDGGANRPSSDGLGSGDQP